GLEIRVLDDDVAGHAGVDQKLVELARRTGSKIVTNDYNLNKVARVQNIPVLNINELANALKPAVLPGESMRVLILREGKEPTQGVAYLDDGTMVVVDGARRLINRTVDILVTSVHQTPAGKMIFGRLDERADSGSIRTDSGSARAATAAAATVNNRAESAMGGNGHTLRPPRPDPSTPIDAPTATPSPPPAPIPPPQSTLQPPIPTPTPTRCRARLLLALTTEGKGAAPAIGTPSTHVPTSSAKSSLSKCKNSCRTATTISWSSRCGKPETAIVPTQPVPTSSIGKHPPCGAKSFNSSPVAACNVVFARSYFKPIAYELR